LIFSDLALSQRLERAEGRASADFVDASGQAFPARGSAWIDVGGALAMFDGVDSPVTQTFALGLNGPVAARDLDRLEEFFLSRRTPVHHEVSPLADASLLMLFQARSYHVIELTSVMWRPIDADVRLTERGNPRLSVRPIRDDEHEVWAETAASGWSHLPELTGYLRQLGAVNAHRRRHVPFIAQLDEQPVAAGGLVLVDGVAILAGACTVPAARRQGAQLALLEARLRHAARQGCDIAMMGAAPGSGSQRNAERQGFRIAYTRIKWRLTPGA
jgi:GNAT superfamily N-acetyltransferase